jgi:hypothetical protein
MLLALGILSVGVLTVVGGMTTSIFVGDLNRRQAEGQTAVRAYAEAVVNDTYVGCATSYPAPGFSVPTGYTGSQAVAYWDSATASFKTTCPTTDPGLQRVTVTIAAVDGRGAEALKVVKRR